jgi:2-methylcitrate dehydratase PrpD
VDASRLIAEMASSASFTGLGPAAIHGAKRGVIDTLAVSVAATGLGEDAQPILDLVRETNSRAEATILGYGGRTSATDAAFMFGSLAHMLDYDDIVDAAVVHPSAAVVATALPLAERVGAVSGEQLLLAVAIGQDVAIRLNEALRHHPPHYGWLPSINAVFAATATAARILQLTAEQTHSALGLAMHQAGGSRQAGAGFASSFRAVRDGFNARTAVTCALLAQHGLRGDHDAFEGRYGLFNLHFGGDFDRKPLLDGLGDDFRGALVGQKPWPSCRFSHVFIAPLLRLLRDHDLRADDIALITAVSSDDLLEGQCEPHAVRARPRHVIDAKTSLPFQLGKIVVNRGLTLSDFTTSGLRDPAAVDVADRVRWRLDDRLAGATLGSGRIELELTDGTHLAAETRALPGSVGDPLSYLEFEAKFKDCLAHSIAPVAPEEADRILARLWQLEACEDVGFIVPQLSAPQ